MATSLSLAYLAHRTRNLSKRPAVSAPSFCWSCPRQTQQRNKATNLLADMAEVVNKVPGMKSIAQPATYTIGWQKVHMAAAQGQPQTSNLAQSQLYTMGLSTNWS